jgi:hypothetical protein
MQNAFVRLVVLEAGAEVKRQAIIGPACSKPPAAVLFRVSVAAFEG